MNAPSRPPMVPLGEVCDINPRMPKTLTDDTPVSFLAMASVSEDGTILAEEARTFGDVKKGYTYFERGDVLLAKITPCFENGKAARTSGLSEPVGFGSTEFHVLRASGDICPNYIFHTVWNSAFRTAGAMNMTGSAGQKRVPADFLKRLPIPLPPLEEQRRIAAILDKADQLRAKRKRALALLDTLTQSIFLEMFGDPLAPGAKTAPLGEIAKFVSGGTPSKGNPDFWNGSHPWVSPKDMKRLLIDSAEDSVSDLALTQTALKLVPKGAVLLVVRGMILVHTVPIALTTCPVTINQDMKALLFRPGYSATLGLWNLRSLHSYILSKVLTAAHGTKRLNMEDVEALPIVTPSQARADCFKSAAAKIADARLNVANAVSDSDSMFTSLQSRAFTGQL